MRVLIAEDEYFIAADIQDALERHGAVVIGPVSELACALDLVCSDTSIDAALVDLDLKGSRAFALADELRRRQVAFAFFTGFGRDAIPEAYQHICRFEKPYSLADVLSYFATVVDGDPRLVGGPSP